MNKKIFGILLVLLMLLTPQKVFAQYFELDLSFTSERFIISNLNANNETTITQYRDDSIQDVKVLKLKENEIEMIIQELKNTANTSDKIIETSDSTVAADFKNNTQPGLKGYLILIKDDNGNFTVYHNPENTLFTRSEWENSKIYELLEKRNQTSFLTNIPTPIIIAPFGFALILLVGKLLKSKTKQKNDNKPFSAE